MTQEEFDSLQPGDIISDNMGQQYSIKKKRTMHEGGYFVVDKYGFEYSAFTRGIWSLVSRAPKPPMSVKDAHLACKKGDLVEVVEVSPQHRSGWGGRTFKVGDRLSLTANTKYYDDRPKLLGGGGWAEGARITVRKVVVEAPEALKAAEPVTPARLPKPHIPPEDGWTFLHNDDIDLARVFKDAEEAGYDAIEIDGGGYGVLMYVTGEARKVAESVAVVGAPCHFGAPQEMWTQSPWKYVYTYNVDKTKAAIAKARAEADKLANAKGRVIVRRI